MTKTFSAMDAFEFTAFVTHCAQYVLFGLNGGKHETRFLPEFEGLRDKFLEEDGIIDFGAPENRDLVDKILPVCRQLIAAADSRGKGGFVRGLFTEAGIAAIEKGTVSGFSRTELAFLDPCYFGRTSETYERRRPFH